MRRNEELGKLQRRIIEAIRALAKEDKYDLLLTDGVIYASEKIDVTQQVQKKLANLSDWLCGFLIETINKTKWPDS